MCRDNDHGGRRCPHDSSDARVARRRNQKARQRAAVQRLQYAGEHVPLASKVAYHDLDAIKGVVAQLQELKQTDPHGTGASAEEIARWDDVMEQELTTLGSVLAARAEARAHFLSEQRALEIETMENSVYGDTATRMTEARTKLREAQTAARPLREALAEAQGIPVWRAGTLDATTMIEQADAELIERLEMDEALVDLAEAERIAQLTEAAYWQADAQRKNNEEAIHRDYNAKLAGAYQHVIAELREVGGEVPVHEGSDEAAVQVLQATVARHYPTDWLAHSRGTGPLRVDATEDRAMYAENSEVLPGEQEQQQVTGQSWFNYGQDDAAGLQPVFERLPEATIFASISAPQGPGINRVSWQEGFLDPYDAETDGPLIEGKPAGDGWVFESHPRGIFSKETEVATNTAELSEIALRPRWYRERRETAKKLSVLKLYVDPENESLERVKGTPEGAAFHEFGHRIEHAFPKNLLARQEQAFLRRRAHQGNFKNQHQNLEALMSAPGELGHDAHMVNTYMAREYFTGKSYEVFATGIEALYGGSFGGLVGNDSGFYTKGDNEHRGFILGALATL
jgi:hypothetical protein